MTAVTVDQGSGAQVVTSGASYKPNGPLASMAYGDGFTWTASYDSSYRLTGLTDEIPSSTQLRDLTLNYTTRDNLASVLDSLDALRNESYQYSARELLSDGDGPWGQIDYAYDAVGNRTTKAVTVSGTTVTDSYSYGGSDNRLASVLEAGSHTRSFTHDAAGNVTYDGRSGGGYGYAYNAAGRMKELTINGVVQAEYLYNARRRQVVRRLTQGVQTIHSVHDLEANRIAEYAAIPRPRPPRCCASISGWMAGPSA